MTVTAMNRKKSRLRLVLIAAAALGCSSAALSGAVGTIAMQQASAGSAQFA